MLWLSSYNSIVDDVVSERRIDIAIVSVLNVCSSRGLSFQSRPQ